MQRYRWPGYEIQLLGELQRQQNNAQFCDTLLQTEGISVPTHSCILAALSPYLSQKLSTSPSPSSGQKRQLKLQSVKAQTLLKLVGLLYSGEVEVKGGLEQNDVLSAARKFGITDLVEGQKDVGMKSGEPQEKRCGGCRERNESRKMQDAQVQAEIAGRRATDCAVGKTSSVSTGTQTAKAGEKTVGSSFSCSGQTKPPTRQPASPVAQSLDFSVILPPKNITLYKHFNSTRSPPIPSIPSGAPGDGESTFDGSSDSVTNPTTISAWFNNVKTFPISLNDDSNTLIPQEDGSCQQCSEFGDRIGMGLEDEQTNAKTPDKRENAEQPSYANIDEILGEKKGNSTEKKHAHVGRKSLAKMKRMQQMIETTQISIKVKLVRTKGKVWEVVSMQNPDETFSVLTSLKQTGLTNSEPSSVQPGPIHKPETPIVQPATANSEPPPPITNTTSDPQLVCSDELESDSLGQPPGPVEESDEQIEKLLEDIMMGLNILPNLERDCKKSRHLQPSHDGAQVVCHVPVSENERAQSETHAADSAAGCVYYQDFSSTDTAQNQPSCSSLSSVQPDAPQCHSSRDGTSHQGTPPSEGQNCPYPEAPEMRSVIPTAFYPTCQGQSSQDDEDILELLPLTNGNEAQSSHSFSLPCMDDLRLPRCLSPLEPFTSTSKHQPVLNNPMNHSDKIQSQPSLHGRPWLTENPGSLQFPLSAITHRESVSLAEDTNHSCWSKLRQTQLEMCSLQNGGTRAESYVVEQGGTISACHQNAIEVKSDHRKMMESLRCKQGDTTGDAAVPRRRKRKRSSHPQDAAGFRLAHKDLEVSDGTKSQINLTVCSVSLSSNNVLAKEREMAISSSNVANKLLEPSTVTECQSRKTRGTLDLNPDRTRIRTRGFLIKTRETPSNTSRENSSVLKPMAHKAKIMNTQGYSGLRQKCGRPPKTKLEESPAASSEKKSHTVPSEQQINNNLLKEEGGEQKRCKIRRRNRSEVEVIPLKKTISAGEAEVDDNNDVIPAVRKLGTPKRAQMINLKEFQKLIKHQHSKTRKSKESQYKDTNETARDVERAEKETDKDITEPQNRDGNEESHVVFNVTVDKNHNQIFNKLTAEDTKSMQDNTNGTTGEETSLSQTNQSSSDVLGEEEAKLAAEREEPLQNPDEARKACEAGVSDTTQQTAINDEGLSHSDAHTPSQGDKMPSDHKSNPQTPERIDPPLSDAAVFIKSTSCDQEEEEEDVEVDVEVDVLIYSPVPHSRVGENELDNMDISEEEEEEEDVNEIDVTGDEAE